MRTVHLAGVIAGVMAIAAAAYTAYWFLAADAIQSRVFEWAQPERHLGWQLEIDSTKIEGFPLRFTVTLRNPAVSAESDGWQWRGERLIAELRRWNLNEVTLRLKGESMFRVRDDALWREMGWQVEDAEAKLVLAGTRRVTDIALDMKSVRVEGLLAGGPAFAQRLRVQSLLPLSDAGGEIVAGTPAEVIKAMVHLESVELPEGIAEGLGSKIESLSLDARLIGPMPGEAKRDAVLAWRDGGGAIELNSLDLRWGPLGLSAQGKITLDPELRPMGALTIDIVGYGDVVDALILSDLIPLGDAFLVKVAFNVMAEKPVDGGPPVLRNLPLTAQNGDLIVGSAAFAKLPSLDLPQ